MDQHLFQEYPEGKRAAYLRDNCNDIENIGYMRKFSPDELSEMKDSLSDLSIDQNDLEEEKKLLMKGINDRIKAITDRKRLILTNLKNKAEYVKEQCYKFVDEDNRETGYYNGRGELVQSRPVKPEEMQRSILSVHRTGTAD